jgi:hypothetical protein
MPDFIKSTPVELRHKFAMQRLRFYADRETTINVDKETALLSIAGAQEPLLLERVLDLLARVFDVGLGLIGSTFVAGAFIVGGVAECFLRLTGEILDLVLRFVCCAHGEPPQ